MKAFALKTAILLLLAAAFMNTSCRTIQYVPVSDTTEVNIKDSLVINIKDSVRITERSVYKDYTGLLDTLRIKKNGVASMTAWADTTHNLINGTLETEPQEEKTRIIYKDRIQYKDSLVYKEVPVEVPIEVVKKIYPRWMIILSILGITLSCYFLFKVYLKFKDKFPL